VPTPPAVVSRRNGMYDDGLHIDPLFNDFEDDDDDDRNVARRMLTSRTNISNGETSFLFIYFIVHNFQFIISIQL